MKNQQTTERAARQGHLGFEATLWATAGKLRCNLDAAEYKHIIKRNEPRFPEGFLLQLTETEKQEVVTNCDHLEILNRQATGFSAIVTTRQEGWLCGTGAILLRVLSDDIDPKFLSFFLSSCQSINWLKQHTVGAVKRRIRVSEGAA